MNWRRAKTVPRLPHRFGSDRGQAVPADLTGAKILSIGTLADSKAVEGGGLVIDYQTAGGDSKRLLLAGTELGMWIIYQGPQQSRPIPASVQ
ncbi:MAG TPA: hypothetical protein VGI81_12535 [Tepidisphaeraceae bacterium]|jgi:hypothetical protein